MNSISRTFSTGTRTKPRIYLEYSFAAGDDDPTDSDSETFQNLFASNHPFYGYMDLFSWQNIHELAAGVKCTPVKNLTAEIYGHSFWLANTNDSWYRANGLTVVRPLTPAAATPTVTLARSSI